jgi:hypothetical protein
MTSRTKSTAVGATLVAILLTAVACGGGGTGETSTTGSNDDGAGPTAASTGGSGATSGATPFEAQRSVTGGCYETKDFTDPSITICIDGTWWFDTDNPIFVGIEPASTYIQTKNYLFLKADRIITPDQTSVEPAPDDLMSWLVDHPGLKVLDGPDDVTVGGIQGQEVDVRAVHPPACTFNGAPPGNRCWFLFPLNEGDPFAPGAMDQYGPPLGIGSAIEDPSTIETIRLVTLDVDGQPIVISFDDLPSEFDTSVKQFEQTLAGISWS